MIQQLVMYEEELAQINAICEALHRDSNAKAVLVIDKNGQAMASAGDVHELDVTSLSSLTAVTSPRRWHRVAPCEKESPVSSSKGKRSATTSRSSASA